MDLDPPVLVPPLYPNLSSPEYPIHQILTTINHTAILAGSQHLALAVMTKKTISQPEIDRYWEIFSTHTSGGSHLSGSSARPIFKNSGLTDPQLEKIWDLSDLDGDGALDFEEFCVGMRMTFDLVNGEIGGVPTQIPAWLVPEGKAHLVQAQSALKGGGERFERPQDDEDGDERGGLRDGFDWYMSPADRAKYEDIYVANSDRRGDVTFESMQSLHDSLDVPESELRNGWNLVNPSGNSSIGKDASLAYLHILKNRHEGYRIPRQIPASLRASFEQNQIDYQVDRVRSPTSDAPNRYDNTRSGQKAKFGDAYLSRLGKGGKSSYSHSGTDFSGSQTTEDWEEVRLKKQLAELDARVKRVEQQNTRRKGGRGREESGKPALVKRELQQLLDYKRKTLRDLERGEGRGVQTNKLKEAREEIETLGKSVQGLEDHLGRRREELRRLKEELEAETESR